MTEAGKCPNCGGELPPGAPGGHCPQCLIRLALDAEPPPGSPSKAIIFPPPSEERVGGTIGHYKLLEKLGEGGFGVVYVAEQQEPVRRRVALKVIKLGMDTRQVVARFEAERQALAMMDHPNIAKVLEAGATEAGRPFFVMELVRGVPITQYRDDNKAPMRKRLGLFTQVCRAIQHAHQKGVIHRDIKPSNILVTLHDGVPVPKVIDFGIAKATQGSLTDKTVYTQFQQFIGTPAYMSPEQAELSGLDIDTRSDVYSLGVLLYELLTGRTPFDAASLRKAGLDQMRRIIREQEPERPSARLSTMAQADLTTVAGSRRAEASELVNLLRGDLDWIVMKSLEKDRTRRFETVNGLATDVQRHLDDEPVMARPPSAGYRFRKMVRRNKLAFAAVGGVAAALTIGLVAATSEFLREKQARQRAVAAEQEQSRQRGLAEQSRRLFEDEAYAADINRAARAASSGTSLGNVLKLLPRWQDVTPDLRGWEWYYLNGLCHRDFMTIRGDSNALWSVAWSPDGSRLASAGVERTVKIWNARTGGLLATFPGHAGAVESVAWSPDGRKLASGSPDKTVKIWDAETGDNILTLRGHTDYVDSVAWSPDGKKLASGSLDGTIKLWNPVGGAEILTLAALSQISSVCWNSDGTRLAAANPSQDKGLMLWDATANSEPSKLSYRSVGGDGRSVSWSPDDRLLAIGGGFGLVISDADRGTNTFLRGGHAAAVQSVAWSPDGTRLASAGGSDTKIIIWDRRTLKPIQTFQGHLGILRSVTWRPDGTQVASAGMDGLIKVWNVNSNDPSITTYQVPSSINSLAWSPDGRRLATSGRNEVWIQETEHDAKPVILPMDGPFVWQVAWSPDGKQLAAFDGDGILKIWNSAGWAQVWSGVAFTNGARTLAWSPDGRRLATVSGGELQVKIWDAANKTFNAPFDLHARGSFSVAWNPDGTKLAVAAGGGVRILDPISGTERWRLEASSSILRSLAWSPDGRRLAAAGDDALARIWDMDTGGKIQELVGHSLPVYSVAWSPDGTRLATGSLDYTVRIWNPASGVEICSFDDSNPHQRIPDPVFHSAALCRVWDIPAKKRFSIPAVGPGI